MSSGSQCLGWEGNLKVDLARLSEEAIPLFATGQFQLTKFVLHNNQLKRDLLKLQSFNATDIVIDTSDKIRFKQIKLQQVALLKRAESDLSDQITSFDLLSVDALQLDRLNALHIDRIMLKNHALLLLKAKDESLEINAWLPGVNTSAEKTEVTASEIAAFHYAIDELIYTSDQSIDYVDNSLGQPFKINIKNTQLSITDIDSSQPEQDSAVSYAALYNEHGKIKLAASNNVLDSKITLALNHFEFKALSQQDADKLDAGFGFPLNPSLSLLRDRDNSIHLSIPVTGDVDNPDFDPSDVITKAMSKAITRLT